MIKPFKNISPKNKEKLIKMLEGRSYFFTRKTIVNNHIQGDNIIGIIENGCIDVIKEDTNGNITILEEFVENDIFSTNSNLSSKDLKIVCKEDTNLIIIDYDYLISKIDSDKLYYNIFLKNLYLIINEKMKLKNERIEILTKKTIRNKLLTYFDIEYNKHKSRNIYLPFNVKDLADYLATDRCALSREMKYLNEEGFIISKGKKIILLYK